MIKIKDYQGYEIYYDERFEQFELWESGDKVSSAKTQGELEEKAKTLSKSEFKRIPIFKTDGEGNTQFGELTSLNRDMGEAWISMGKTENMYGSGRSKITLRHSREYFEKTPANFAIIEALIKKHSEIVAIKKEIEALRIKFEKPITQEYFGLQV